MRTPRNAFGGPAFAYRADTAPRERTPAREFGIAPSQALRVARGDMWRHVPLAGDVERADSSWALGRGGEEQGGEGGGEHAAEGTGAAARGKCR